MNELLPVLDDLERALEAAAEHEEAKLEEGVQLVHRSLAALLERHGLTEIETEGAFDPHVHEALLAQPARGCRGGLGAAGAAEGLPARRQGDPSRAGDRRRMTNLYDTLGVAKNASAEEIKKAYRKLAREHHPEQRRRRGELQGDPGRVRRALRRREAQPYDQYGSTNGRGPMRRRAGGTQFQDFDLSDLSAISSAAFGGGGGFGRQRGPQPERGADLQTEVHVSFEDSLKGVQVPVRAEVETACHTCGGTGAEPGTAPIVVPAVRRPRRHLRLAGPLLALASVPALSRQRHGDREAVQDLPRQRSRARAEDVPGEDPGRRQGRHADPAEGARRAGPQRRSRGRSLVVIARVADSPVFERRGSDLIVDVPVSYADAALGA